MAVASPANQPNITSHPSSMSSATNMLWFKSPPSVYFGCGTTGEALRDLGRWHLQRCFLLCDRSVLDLGFTKSILERLDEMDMMHEIYADVSTASDTVVESVSRSIKIFRPDCMIAIGGGSVMDVAKICRVIYDPSNPHTKLEDLYAYDHLQLLTDTTATKAGIARLPPCDQVVKALICIPTTSSTGSEMSPISWVLQKADANTKYALKRPIVSWRMIPDMSIVDGFYTKDLPKSIAAAGGMAVLNRAFESAVSKFTSDYTIAFSIRSIRLLFEHLVSSVKQGDGESRTHCHNAASIAGLAAGNAFVGIAHALTFALQQLIELKRGTPISLGVASGLVLPQVIKFNSTRSATAAKTYAQISSEVFPRAKSADSESAKIDILVEEVQKLKKALDLPMTLKQFIDEAEFEAQLDVLAEESLKVVGCTLTNPAYVSLDDAKQLLRAAFTGA